MAHEHRQRPTAVDGVITPVRAKVPAGLATTRPINDEYEAMQHLEMAQLYIDNDMTGRAAQLLNEVVRDYGHTKAASLARNILARLE